MVKGTLIAFCVLIVPVIGAASADSPWLGIYVGARVPGHHIVKSQVIVTRYSGGPTEALHYDKGIKALGKECRTDGGVALVNLHISFELGSTSEGEGGRVKTHGASKEYLIYADCVLTATKEDTEQTSPAGLALER